MAIYYKGNRVDGPKDHLIGAIVVIPLLFIFGGFPEIIHWVWIAIKWIILIILAGFVIVVICALLDVGGKKTDQKKNNEEINE